MKVLLAVLAVLLLTACGGTELKTTPIEVPEPAQEETISEPEPEPVQEPAPEPEVAQEETISEPEPERDPEAEACQAYIERMIEDVEDAQEELDDAEKAYIDADEKFEDLLDRYGTNETLVIEAREERNAADEAQEDAEDALYSSERRLRKAREECGIY